ncbi:MAG TPA: hypothetical protein VF136_18580 [Methylomirabilota bacterium]
MITSPSALLLATLSGYLVLVHSLVLAAGLLGQLTAAGLGALLAVALAPGLLLARRLGRDRADAEAAPPPTVSARFAAAAGSAALLAWVWPHLFHATRLWIWDDYTYHLVYPALWLRAQAIAAPGPLEAFTMQAWYPLSASVVAAWFMAPWPGSRGEALAWVSLTGPLYAGLAVGAAASLLARLGCRPGAWAVPAVLLATSPRIGVMASSFSDADLAQAAALLGAFAFAVPHATERPEDVRADAWYAGLLSGLALGVKASAAPPALVVLALLTLRARALPPPMRRRATAALALTVAGSWIATAGYWYARNLLVAGNPLYPAAFLAWPGTTFPETTLREYAQHYGLGRTVRDALVVYADWPRSHALLAAVGLTSLGVWTVRRRRVLTRPQRYFAGGALALVATVLVLVPLAPYSAGNAMTFRSGFIHWDSMRYIAVVPILGWIAVAVLLDRWGSLSVAILVALAMLGSGLPVLGSPLALLALALGAVGLARLGPGAAAPTGRAGRALAVGAPALLLAAVVTTGHGAKAAATASALQAEPLFGGVVQVLDRQPAGTRVAVFGDQWIYPAFGARHHLRPIRLDRDGRLARGPIGDAMAPGDLTVDAPTFRANLAAAGIGLVVVVHLPHPGRSPQWPAQQRALETLGDAQLLYRGGGAAVWRLSAPERPRAGTPR